MVTSNKLTTNAATNRKGKRSRPNNNNAAMTIPPAADPSSASVAPPPSSSNGKTTVYSSSMESYLANANGTSVRRIRTPHPHDVLSGRGGGINSHPGNVQFRSWVSTRKNDYNLALNKADKAAVARQIVNMVKAQNPPGRFLTKDPSGASGLAGVGGWWVELDDERTMAKTAQALREGAPAIRAEHADELLEMKREIVEHRKHRHHSSHHHKHPQKQEEEPPRLLLEPRNDENANDEEFSELVLPARDSPPQKRVRVEYNGAVVRPTDATPPLLPSEPVLSLADLPPLDDHRIFPLPPPSLPKRPSLEPADNLKRAHSLAFSEDTSLGEWVQDDFVNPFDGEDEMARLEAIRNSAAMNHPVNGGSVPPLPSRTNFLSSSPRDTSTTSSHGDMGGISSLLHGNNNNSSNGNGGLANHRSGSTSVRSRTTSLGNVSSRYEFDALEDFDSVYYGGSSDATTSTTTTTTTMEALRDALRGSDPLNLWFDGDTDHDAGLSSSESYFQWWELPVIPRPVSPSLTSILSDLPDATSNAFLSHGTDFMEGMKSIYDALHDDDYRDADGDGASFPTFQLPYRGGNGVLFSSSHLQSRRNSSLAARGLDGRQ